MSARPTATIWRWPPERWPARTEIRSRRSGNNRSTFSCCASGRFGIVQRAELQVLLHREPGEDVSGLRNVDQSGLHALVGRKSGYVPPEKPDGSRRNPHEARNRLDQSRLAGPVRTKQSHDFARQDLEADPVENRRRGPVPGCNRHRLQEWLSHRRHGPPACFRGRPRLLARPRRPRGNHPPAAGLH